MGVMTEFSDAVFLTIGSRCRRFLGTTLAHSLHLLGQSNHDYRTSMCLISS
jgi:hypothetical protein